MAYLAGTKNPVDTGDTYFNELGTSLANQTLTMRKLIRQKPISDKPPLSARVNYGRWVVSCPNCNNVEFAFEDGLFFCSQCNNGNGQTRQVVLPVKRKKIEDILGKRMIINRHWNPTETVNDLLAENIAENIERKIGEV